MKGVKFTEHTDVPLADAVSTGISELQELGEEMRSWADNMESGNLGHTDKFYAVSEAAEQLEYIDEPDVPEDWIGELTVTFSTGYKKRGTPRWLRRDNATAPLQAAKDALEEWLEENSDNDQVGDIEELRDALEEAVSNAEAVEFPGMFG